MLKTLTPFLLIFLTFQLFAQDQQYYLHLKSKPGVPRVDQREVNPYQALANEVINGKVYRLVQFQSKLSIEDQFSLKEEGIEILDYVPNNAYYLAVPVSKLENLPQSRNIRLAIRPTIAFKKDPSLFQKPLPAFALKDGKIRLDVTFYRNISREEVQQIIGQQNWISERITKIGNVATLQVEKEKISNLTSHPAVQYVELTSPPGEPENYNSAMVNRSALINGISHSEFSFDGSGVNVQLQDDGIIGPHIDFKNRIQQQFTQFNFGNHGDHTAGTIAAAGNLDPRGQGMAPGAQLYVYNYDEFNDSINTHHDQYDISITSTSYSNGCNDGYTATARTHDLQVNQYPDLTHVFSAGNSNGQNCGYGAGSLWGNVTGGHKVGKNVIAVANTDNFGNISNSSSRGPAHDGRIKPDIAAKGSDVYSTVFQNNYEEFSGTSMSCPAVAGSIALLYEAYMEQHNGQKPPSALIKNYVLNTANDLGNKGPDFIYGWGMLNTYAAMQLLTEEGFDHDSIAQNGLKTYNLTIPKNKAEARIMLYWHDEAASTGVSKALVNDLDLIVIAPNGDTLRPYILNSAPDPDSLSMPATTGEDHLNNMEQVYINLPTSGNYMVQVSGYDIPLGNQSFYLSYYLPDREIQVTYPNGGEGFSPNDNEVVVSWENFTKNQQNIDLYYSADSGQTWNTVVEQIGPDQFAYFWSLPFGISGNLLFKAESGSYSDVSDSFFTVIGTPQNLEINRSCCESFEVSWSPIASADSYRVYLLDSLYMEPVGTTTGTSMMVPFEPGEEVWVTVSAMMGDGEGMRAYAIFKKPGAFECNADGNIALETITSPGEGLVSSCIYNDSLPVALTIANYSSIGISDYTIFYTFQNNTVSYDPQVTLPAGEQVTVEFPQKLPLPSSGDYEIEAWINHPLDVNLCDDTATINFRVVNSLTVTAPWKDDLEINFPCSEAQNCGFTTCNLSNGLINAPNGISDDIDWRTDRGGTGTQATGPTLDHEPGTISGHYLYLEASGDCIQQVAILQLPCFDLKGLINPKFSYWYHMYGEDMGTLSVEVNDGSGWTQESEWIGNRGNRWQEDIIDLSAYKDKIISIRLVGTTGNSYLSDLALDDFNLFDDTPIEAEIVGPDTLCSGNEFTFSANVNTNISSASWDFGTGATPATAKGLDTFSVQYSTVGQKEITLKLTRPSDSVIITKQVVVTSPPEADFEYYPQAYKTLKFVNNAVDAKQYKWQFGDGDSSFAFEPIHEYDQLKEYEVSLEVSQGGCSNSISKIVSTTLPPEEGDVILLYPNPADQIVNIQIVSLETNRADLQLVNAKGQLVWDIPVNGFKLNGFDLDVSTLAAGIYFIKLNVRDEEYIKKLIIARN